MERKFFIVVGIVFLLVGASTLSGLRLQDDSITNVAQFQDKSVKVVVGPKKQGKIDLDKCTLLTEMTEEEAAALTESLLDVDNIQGLSTLESLEKTMTILRDYKIFPPNFTLENITKLLENMSYNKKSQNKGAIPTPMIQPTILFDKTYTNWGPHMFLYISFGTAATTFPIPPYGFGQYNKSGLQELFPFLEQFTMLDNFSVFSYSFFTTAEFMFGGSLGTYYSVGLFPSLSDSTFHFSGPFYSVYLLLGNVGIYVFNEGNVETPYLDIYLGVSPLFSIQQLIFPEPGS